MSNKFLSTSTANLGDGSVDIFASTLSANNLDSGTSVKVNSQLQIYSTNLEIADINGLATSLSGALLIDGSNAMTDTLKAADGTAALPGLTFSSDDGSGLSDDSGDLVVSSGGAEVFRVTDEIKMNGDINVNGNNITDSAAGEITVSDANLVIKDTTGSVLGDGVGYISFEGAVGGISAFVGEQAGGATSDFLIKSYATGKAISIEANSNVMTLLPTGVLSVPGEIDMNSNKITDLLDPTSLQDAATKNYVDGIDFIYSLSTGLQTGGVLSIGTPNTTFTVTDGSGIIMTSDPLGAGTISKTEVSWTGKTNISVTDIATQLITFVCIDSGGNVVQLGARPTDSQRRTTYIFLGVVVHVDNTIVDAVNNEQDYIAYPMSQLRDLSSAIGFLNASGNVLSKGTGLLEIQKSVGTMFATGANYNVDPFNPNIVSLAAVDPITFQYRLQDGTNIVPDTSDIDPSNYDNAGTLTAMTNNYWSVQRVYLFTSGNIKIQPGQAEYKTSADASGAIETETFVVEPSIAANGLHISNILVQKGETDLTNATFFTIGKFGSATSSSGGDVYGPSPPVTDTSIVLFDGTSGKLLQDSGVTIDGSDNLTGIVDLTMSGDLKVVNGTTPIMELTDTGNTAWGDGSGSISFKGSVGGLSVLIGESGGGDNFKITSYNTTKGIDLTANGNVLTLGADGVLSIPGRINGVNIGMLNSNAVKNTGGGHINGGLTIAPPLGDNTAFTQVGDVVSGATANDQLGFGEFSIISANEVGSRVVYGAAQTSGAGYIKVLEIQDGAWTEMTVPASFTGGANHGLYKCTMNASGTRVAIASIGSSFTGVVKVFEYDELNSTWDNQIYSDITVSLAVNDLDFDCSGKRLLIGTYTYNNGAANDGKVWVFTDTGAAWTEAATLLGTASAADWYGYSVSMSSCGSRISIGIPETPNGSVEMWEDTSANRDGTTWTQVNATLSGTASGDDFGRNNILSGDGKTVIIGAIFNASNAGRVYVYEDNGSAWVQKGTDIAGGSSETLGQSLSINHDGSRILIGNSKNGSSLGKFNVYDYVSADWSSIFQQAGAASGGRFGLMVHMNKAGNFIATSAGLADTGGTDTGSIYMYRQISTLGLLEVSGDVNISKDLNIQGTKVLGVQGSAVADATGSGDAHTQLNLLLAELRTHGLIAT